MMLSNRQRYILLIQPFLNLNAYEKFFILCCLWIACCAISAQEPCPQVIPALQQWKGGSGKLALPAEGNIVVNPADEAVLLSTAEILADDLSLMMGWDYSVKIGKPGKMIFIWL